MYQVPKLNRETKHGGGRIFTWGRKGLKNFSVFLWWWETFGGRILQIRGGGLVLQKISSKIFYCWFFAEKNPPVVIIKIIKIDFFYVKYTVNFLWENLFENSVTTSNIFRFINFGDKHKCLYKKISNDQSFWISKKMSLSVPNHFTILNIKIDQF